ncbi:MAG: hypothetical protein UY44_C0002G0038 [Candidatus Kaiserbacteria bacterium GW2011_GWA2_49_19]|uniref:Uncharacterized protein n=2 Tax=Candidatus Kaiseribacteriota TaxID=1752734 RepID=A0A0G1VSA5_9BACT|nr:MAG: hypothetical protein UY44_C0002G0038 [Candidatus Kaiserbacteria bacterium GW2011_GWA2_49_19]
MNLMTFERLANKIETDNEAVGEAVWAALREIENKSPEIAREFQALTPDQQDLVAGRVLARLNQSQKDNMRNIIPGTILSGLMSGGIASSFSNNLAVAGTVGGIVAIIVAALVPIMGKLGELKARRFLDTNRTNRTT